MAKIKNDAIDWMVSTLRTRLTKPLSVMEEEYAERKVSHTQLLWDLFWVVERQVKLDGYFTTFNGTANRNNWHDASKYVYEGQLNDSHIETAMRAVYKRLKELEEND